MTVVIRTLTLIVGTSPVILSMYDKLPPPRNVHTDASSSREHKNFTLPSGYDVTLDEDGLSAVSFDGAQVATGNVQMLDGTWFYEPYANRDYTPAVSSKTVTYLSKGAKVVHSYSGVLQAVATYTYEITGDDILVGCYGHE